MSSDLLSRLQAVAGEEAREQLLLQLRLETLSPAVQRAVQSAAIPHWFDVPFLEALLDEADGTTLQSDFEELTNLSFVERFPGRGYNVHERTRRLLLNNLWQNDPDRYRTLSDRAAAYCATQDSDNSDWQMERIYHLLVSQPEEGSRQLRHKALTWRNFPHTDYDKVEALVRLALEHLEAGRLSPQHEGWAVFWQAHIDWLYGREAEAKRRLLQITADAAEEPVLAAEKNRALGDLYRKATAFDEALSAYREALRLYRGLGDRRNATIVQGLLDDPRLDTKGLLAATEQDATEITKTKVISDWSARIRQTLLENVRSTWIDGVLNQSLQHELALEQEATAVVQPVPLTLHVPGQIDRELPPDMSIRQLFEASGRSLLILGAPGSGKTITLLQLTRELLKQARADSRASIPLVFNLSSWEKKQGSLAAWLVEEAFLQYQLKRSFTRDELLPSGSIVLLLDGLDEVPLAARSNCVAAINVFLQAHPVGVAVCSRTADYDELNQKLKMQQAVVLQPLSGRQIEEFLAGAISDEATLQLVSGLLRRDRQLRELARTPLMLNVVVLTYQDTDVTEMAGAETVADRRRHLLARYVDRMLNRPPLTADGYHQDRAVSWLAHLAREMQKQGHSVFYLEDMQPTFLTQRSFAWYTGSVGLVGGLVGGLSVGLVEGLTEGLIFGLILGLVLGPVGGLVRLTQGITMRERLQWLIPTKKRFVTLAWSGTWYGLVFGLVFGLSVGLTDGLVEALVSGLIVGLILGLVGGLVGSLGAFFDAPPVEARLQPGRGVRSSLRNGILMTLVGAPVFGVIGIIFDYWLNGGGDIVTFILAALLPVAFLYYGGLAFIQHYTLRVALAAQHRLPLRLIPFLEAMNRRVILRRVGGGYIFVHRTLLEYFADLDV